MALPSTKELIEKDLFELLGIPDASDEYKAQLLRTMTTTIDARVVNRVAGMLSEEDAKSFEQITEEGNPESIVQFLVSKGIDLPAIVVDEATRHRVEMVSVMRLVQDKQ